MPATPQYETVRQREKCITADQMGTFHMTKPINHLGGTQVRHSRAATHHFTVYRPQTHGHQSMAPLRTNASPLPYRFMADDFIITHPSLSFSSSRSAPSAEECDELSNNPFFHAPTADLATSADDSPRANPRSLTCAWDSRLWSEPMLCIENAVEKQEGGAYFYVPGWYRIIWATSKALQPDGIRCQATVKQWGLTGRMEKDECRRGILIPLGRCCRRTLKLTCKHAL